MRGLAIAARSQCTGAQAIHQWRLCNETSDIEAMTTNFGEAIVIVVIAHAFALQLQTLECQSPATSAIPND